MRKILLITDMDGTLLPKNKVLNPIDIEAVNKFCELGCMFSVATGRSLNSASRYFDELPINAPVVLFNGGVAYDVTLKKSVMQCFMHENAYNVTADILNKFKNVGCEIDTENFTYVTRTNPEEDIHIEISYSDNEYAFADLDSIKKGNWLKVLFADTAENIDVLVEHIKNADYKNVDFVRSSGTYLEMLPEKCSKGTALNWITENYHLQDYIVAACGDYHNDIEMLDTADIAVVPANSLDIVKEHADYVAKAECSDGFIAEAIEYVLNACLNACKD